jgi:general secretion pathway protein G
MFCNLKLASHAPSRRGSSRSRRRGNRGFSFIEIMVVVVIMGLLASAVTVKVIGYMDTAKVNRAKSDIATIVDAVEAFHLKNGRYPTNEEGLEKLPLKNRLDPWGNTYEYNCPGHTEPFEVVSFGADGREGGDGMDADICSWQLGDKPKKE